VGKKHFEKPFETTPLNRLVARPHRLGADMASMARQSDKLSFMGFPTKTIKWVCLKMG
jgi:hypothetical protein